MKACATLLSRMEIVKKQLKDPKWEQVVQKCHGLGIDLKASYQLGPNDAIEGYDVWGVIATEIEIDCLTGENKVIYHL